MIVTLTPNTGIDHTVRIPGFRLNSTIRASDSAWGMGGKATDVSWILGRIGIPTRALGFAAGSNGLRMQTMLNERGVDTDFVWVHGETRLNTVIIVPGQGQSTITTSSLEVSEEQLSTFTFRYEKALEDASCVVMGGSLPEGVPAEFYAQTIEQAHAFGVPVIFDSSGPTLATGIKGRPDLIKPNQTELGDLLGTMPTSKEEIKQAAVKMREEFGCDVIVTLAEEGAIAISGSESYFVEPLSVPVISSAGAGDGVLAGMALACLQRETFEQGLRYGFALAGAVLQTLATADLDLGTYQELLPKISISPM